MQENAMKPLSQERWAEVLLADLGGRTSTSETLEEAAASTSYVTHPEDRRWRKVGEQETLGSVLAKRDHVIPGIPGKLALKRCITLFCEQVDHGRFCLGA
jgi:hypothetical protein